METDGSYHQNQTSGPKGSLRRTKAESAGPNLSDTRVLYPKDKDVVDVGTQERVPVPLTKELVLTPRIRTMRRRLEKGGRTHERGRTDSPLQRTVSERLPLDITAETSLRTRVGVPVLRERPKTSLNTHLT